MEALQEAAVGETIVNTLKSHDGYVTINYLSQKTGSPPQTIQEYVALHPEKVRKSKIQTDGGDTLYTLNTPLSGLADAWQAFRFVNAKKF